MIAGVPNTFISELIRLAAGIDSMDICAIECKHLSSRDEANQFVASMSNLRRGSSVKVLGNVHLSVAEILGKTDPGPAELEEITNWRHVIDSRHPECWYRLTGTGQVEILALGARVVVPVDSLSLLPEPVARAVLSELTERVGGEAAQIRRNMPK